MSTSSFSFLARTEADTERLGAAVAAVAEPGIVIALIGHLGAGKTRFVRAFAAAAGADPAQVASPTFMLIHEYEARWPIYHFDTYRLGDAGEFLDLGWDEISSGDGVCCVEWADRVSDVLPDDHLRIEITATGDTERQLQFQAQGPRTVRLLTRLQEHLAANSVDAAD